MTVTPEAALAEANMILAAVERALNGEEPSDFELSFSIVRKAWDAVADKVAVLDHAKQLIAKGRVSIDNAAVERGPNSVVVRGFNGGLELLWCRDGIGFGGLTMSASEDGHLLVDTERMDEKFCMGVLQQAFTERHEVG